VDADTEIECHSSGDLARAASSSDDDGDGEQGDDPGDHEQGDDNGDHGDGEHGDDGDDACSADALNPGTKVDEAELKLTRRASTGRSSSSSAA
jgi:hypothetical protein